MHWDYGWGTWIGWLFMMVIFWALVILGIVYLIRSVVGKKNEGKTESALDILKKRYAKGEITKEEFEEKKKDLV